MNDGASAAHNTNMSKEIALLPGERVVMSSDQNVLVLTNQRVRYHSSLFGSSQVIGITLDSVASCGAMTSSMPLLLVLAGATFIGAFALRRDGQAICLVAGVLLVVAYLLTRRAVIYVASNGGDRIVVPAKGMSKDSILEFIDAVEREKVKLTQPS
jgi:hypothetical protein